MPNEKCINICPVSEKEDDISSDPEIQKHMALFCAGAKRDLFGVDMNSLYTEMMSNNKQLASF